MTFSRKIFFAVLITTMVVGTAITLTTYRYVREQTQEAFVSRYTVFSKVLGDTLTRLDQSTESLMHNAAQVLNALDAEKGLLSTDELKSVRSQLNVTHIFVVNRDGRFIRSTNEDPSLIPNVFSFCPSYKNMIVGNVASDATPIIHPQPEPKPYKFLFVPNRTRERLLEVGVRVDFVAKTLTEALGADANVLSMAVYDPSGTSFGTITSKEYQFTEKKIRIPEKLPTVLDDGNVFRFYTKVTSSHPQCCQCDVSGTSKNGEYFYVLESVISKKEMSAALAKTKIMFIIFGLSIILISSIFGKILVRKLVKNIETAAEKIRAIRHGEDIKGRLNMDGDDEVAYLTKEFDHLLDSLETSQSKIIEVEKMQAKIQLATEVAHNIKSPALAIEMMLPRMFRLPDSMLGPLKSSVKEIRSLADRLKKSADTMSVQVKLENELIYLPTFLHDFVAQKNFELQARKAISVQFQSQGSSNNLFVRVCSVELKSILSNVVNNAADSYGATEGKIDIILRDDKTSCCIEVADAGAGIPSEYLTDLGKKRITFKGSATRGVGLVHAYKVVELWGGTMGIESQVGKGTSVFVTIPKYIENQPTKNDLALTV